MVTLYPLLLSDDRAVPGAEHCDVHNADMAAGDRVRPRLRRPHAQNVAVSRSGGRWFDYVCASLRRNLSLETGLFSPCKMVSNVTH